MHGIQAARSVGHQGQIHLVSDTSGPAFNPMLSPYYLAGQIPFDRCFPFGKNFYRDHEVTCHFSSPVVALDPFNKEVHIEDGKRLSYDRCLIATGASPALPKIEGLKGSRRVITLRTAKDTIRLHHLLSSIQNAVVLGASLVGIKMAEILVKRNIKVTLLDIADQVLPDTAHPECGSILREVIAGKDVDLRLSHLLEGTEDDGKSVRLHFPGKPPLTTDLCLVCIGVRPNMDFISNSGIETDKGILIDDQMRTSADDLYAAGDVSQGMNLLTGKREIIGLWGNACYQGRTAGFNMSGMEVTYPGTVPQHISSLFGVPFVRLGDIHRQGEQVRVISNRDLSEGSYCLMAFDRGKLVGVNMLNSYKNAGRLKTAIIRKADWSPYLSPFQDHLTDQEIDRVLAVLLPQ